MTYNTTSENLPTPLSLNAYSIYLYLSWPLILMSRMNIRSLALVALLKSFILKQFDIHPPKGTFAFASMWEIV